VSSSFFFTSYPKEKPKHKEAPMHILGVTDKNGGGKMSGKGGYGAGFALLVVLFILLIIVGAGGYGRGYGGGGFGW
jgi:uncharacterized protein (TIGR01732 family)